MWVTLNDAEQKLATYLAKARYQNARKRGIEDKKMGPQGNWETDLEGIAAEIAFCKIFNIYPDTDIALVDMPVEDAVLRDGRTVDVKSTKYPNGHLLAVKGKKEMPVNCYALMIGEFPKYRFAGMCSREALIDDANLKNLGHGEGYALEQGKLVSYVDIDASV